MEHMLSKPRVMVTYGRKRPREAEALQLASDCGVNAVPDALGNVALANADSDREVFGDSLMCAVKRSFIVSSEHTSVQSGLRFAGDPGQKASDGAASCPADAITPASPLEAVARQLEQSTSQSSDQKCLPNSSSGTYHRERVASRIVLSQASQQPDGQLRTPLAALRPSSNGGLITSFFGGTSGLLSVAGARGKQASTGLAPPKRASLVSAVTPGAVHVDGQRMSPLGCHTQSPTSPSSRRSFSQLDILHGMPSSSSSALPCASGSSSCATLQLHLDLGQKQFGSITCAHCGMLYTPGLDEDDNAHTAYCGFAITKARKSSGLNRSVAGLSGAGSNGQTGKSGLGRVTITFPGWMAEVVAAELGQSFGARARIVHVSPSDAASHPSQRSKQSEIDALLLDQLGVHSAPRNGPERERQAVQEAADRGEVQAGEVGGQQSEVHRFLAVVGGILAGAVVVEKLSPARARRIHADGGEVGEGMPLQLTVPAGTPYERATLGVAQVWTHPSYRRRGLAHALLDAARAKALYAYPVPLQELAFSQPTREGYALAVSYTQCRDFLVY